VVTTGRCDEQPGGHEHCAVVAERPALPDDRAPDTSACPRNGVLILAGRRCALSPDRFAQVGASGLDDQMSQLFGRQCSHSGLLIRRTHIIANLLAVLIGSIVVGLVVSNLVVAMAVAIGLGSATTPLVDRRILALADGDVVQARCAPFRRKPARLLPPLTAQDLGERPFGPNNHFALSIRGAIFVLQGRSQDFAGAYRAAKFTGT